MYHLLLPIQIGRFDKRKKTNFLTISYWCNIQYNRLYVPTSVLSVCVAHNIYRKGIKTKINYIHQNINYSLKKILICKHTTEFLISPVV